MALSKKGQLLHALLWRPKCFRLLLNGLRVSAGFGTMVISQASFTNEYIGTVKEPSSPRWLTSVFMKNSIHSFAGDSIIGKYSILVYTYVYTRI